MFQLDGPTTTAKIHTDDSGNRQLRIVVSFPTGGEFEFGWWLEYMHEQNHEWQLEVARKAIADAAHYGYKLGQQSVRGPIRSALNLDGSKTE